MVRGTFFDFFFLVYLNASEGRQERGLHGAPGCKMKICPEPEGLLN